MEKCFVKTLKTDVSIDNPEYLGFAKVYVQNIGDSAQGIKCFSASGRRNYFPVGSSILGDGVFSTGKRIVEEGDSAEIPANSAFFVLVPKYVNFIVPKGVPTDAESAKKANAVYDLDDFAFDLTDGDISTNGTGTLVFNPTTDGHHFSGNFEKIVPYISGSTDSLNINDPQIELNLDETELYKKGVIRCQHVFINGARVTGSLDGFISKWFQYRKAEAIAATGDKRFAIYNSGVSSIYFNPQIDSSVLAHLNGTSQITITQGAFSVNYNIETDTFSV